MDETPATAAPGAPEEHGTRLRNNALNLLGNVGLALGSAAPTASIALTLAAIVAASSYASPVAILIIGLPMLGIAAAFKRLNRWHVNCGATYQWGARAISPYYGFMVGWLIFLAYFVGVISICLPIGPHLISLFGNAQSRLGEAIIGSAAVVAVTVVAYIGIRVAAWVQWALIAIEYIGGVPALRGVEVGPRPRRLDQRQPRLAIRPAGDRGGDHAACARHAVAVLRHPARGVPARAGPVPGSEVPERQPTD
jgi:hypothetical protein